MSRVANSPVPLPDGVKAKVQAGCLKLAGAKGELQLKLHEAVQVRQKDGQLRFSARSSARGDRALAGTARALASNMATGVSAGFERRLELHGVGYRAQARGRTLTLQLGFSHPIEYRLPEGVEAVTPTQTEVILRGADKQRVGQAAAEIRGFSPPEPYKGKGVRYAQERVRRKEAKKKK